MGFFDILLVALAIFGGVKIFQGTGSVTARVMMFGFIAFILISWYV